MVIPGPAGSKLSGRELGRGPVTLVLAHGASTDMTSWYASMDELAGAGCRVVVQHARATGATKVVVMGSSLGAQPAGGSGSSAGSASTIASE